MQTSKIDRILSAWGDEGETLRYKQIKQFVVRKGVIRETNDRSLSRWLQTLVKEGLLEKTENGYTLKKRPKVYQVFDYLNELRQKYGNHIYEGEIGGFISHVCALTYLNFDEALLQLEDERIAFGTLSIRIGELFWALYELKNAVLKRRCGLEQLNLPDAVIRESFFGLLDRSIGEHLDTDEIVEEHSSHLTQGLKDHFDHIWKNKHSRGGYFDDLAPELFFDEIEKDPEGYEKHLKKTAKIDLDKYTMEELIEKFVKIRKWIKKNHEKEMKEHSSFMYTSQESELESDYRTAILTKVAEAIKALGTSTEDFAVIATRHPATMNEYYTPEHILKEAIEWAQKPPEDHWGQRIWQESREEEKTFEGMVAEHLAIFGWHFPRNTYAKMRSLPWLRRELMGRGDFNKILKLYSKKRKNRLQRDRKAASAFEEMIKGLDEPTRSLNDSISFF